jgi:hypothetical protein
MSKGGPLSSAVQAAPSTNRATRPSHLNSCSGHPLHRSLVSRSQGWPQTATAPMTVNTTYTASCGGGDERGGGGVERPVENESGGSGLLPLRCRAAVRPDLSAHLPKRLCQLLHLKGVLLLLRLGRGLAVGCQEGRPQQPPRQGLEERCVQAPPQQRVERRQACASCSVCLVPSELDAKLDLIHIHQVQGSAAQWGNRARPMTCSTRAQRTKQ